MSKKKSDQETDLLEYADIPGHIDFAEQLIGRYDWDKATGAHLTERLERIRQKQRDRALNLSVIGEFSTGKSSFINALLGCNLLRSSSLQGTTVVNTVIEYDFEPSIEIIYADGTTAVGKGPKTAEGLSRSLSRHTTDPASARAIKMVRVKIPSPLLASGVRIIDTPGTNSLDSWHEDVTREALRELSDLSIVLVDAMHPLSQTLLDFMAENLSEVYGQCAFVVTYYDMLRPREREETLAFIRKRLSHELEIASPQVFPFVAPALLPADADAPAMREREAMAAVSIDSRDRLIELMGRRRQISQITKLLALTRSAYDALHGSVAERKTKIDADYARLLSSRQAPLEPFIETHQKAALRQFANAAQDVKDNLQLTLDRCVEVARKTIIEGVYNSKAQTANDFSTSIKVSVPLQCKQSAEDIAAAARREMKELGVAFEKVMKQFQSDFQKEFRKLGILEYNFGKRVMKLPPAPQVSLDSLQGSMKYIDSEVSRENWALGSGGVAGAAIGTALFPGVGTVVGGLIGIFVGGMTTPSIDTIKDNAAKKLEPQLDTMLRGVQNDCVQALANNVHSFNRSIKTQTNRYLTAYREEVERQISEHEQVLASYKKQAASCESDLKMITQRRDLMKSISKALQAAIK